tara:strand:+ start:1102 stop:1227 length:126 start_codon:yes stop_codon:yes gene_type:complete
MIMEEWKIIVLFIFTWFAVVGFWSCVCVEMERERGRDSSSS